MQVLAWGQIQPIAEKAFAISTTGNERYWARYAWQTLTDADLAAYEDDLGRHRAVIRFLALGGTYADWSDVAWGDGWSDPQYGYWVDESDISAFRIGQLTGAEYDSYRNEFEDAILVSHALRHLADDAREEVVAALLKHFGGEEGLFVSLWRSRDLPYLKRQFPALEKLRLPPTRYSWTVLDEEEDEEITDDEMEWAILSEATADKMAAFSWIDDGCPPYR